MAFSRAVLSGNLPPRMMSQTLVSCHLLGYSAFYMLDGEVVTESPPFSDDLEDALKGHVGTPAWDDWARMRTRAAAVVSETTSAWKNIVETLAPFAKKAGLVPIQKYSSEEVDAFWPALFVRSIWTEQVEPFNESVLFLKDAKLVEESLVVPVRHTLDVVNVWVFQGSNMVRSQTREPVEVMKAAWKEILDATMPTARRLSSEREEVLRAAPNLLEGLKKLESEVERTGRLPGSCPVCQGTPLG